MAWQSARALALGPELAAAGLARRPYNLRHAARSLWLKAGGDPAQIAARAGNSVAVLLTVYTHCIHGHDDLLNEQIDHVLKPLSGSGPCPSVESPRPRPTAQLCGSQRCTDRATGTRAVRYASVDSPPATDGPQIQTDTKRTHPKLAHRPSPTVRKPLAAARKKPVPPSDDTGFDLRKQGGRCWVRTNVG